MIPYFSLDTGRLVLALATIVTIFASVLRFYNLDSGSLWSDEFFSFHVSDPALSPSEAFAGAQSDPSNPPLYYLALYAFFKVVGFNAYGGRALSALAGVGGLLCFYLLVKTKWNIHTALVVTSVLSVHNIHFFYSQEARSYALLFLLVTMYLLSMVRLIKHPGIVSSVLLGLSIALCAYTHYLAIPLIAIHLLVCILLLDSGKAVRISIFNGGLIFIVLAAPLLSSIVTDFQSSADFWTEALSIKNLLQVSTNLAGGKFAVLALIGIALVTQCKGVLQDRFVMAAILTVFIYLSLAIAYSIYGSSIFETRYFVSLLPLLFLILAHMLDRLKHKQVFIPVILFCFAWPTFFASTNAFDRRGHGHNPRALIHWIELEHPVYPLVKTGGLPTIIKVYNAQVGELITADQAQELEHKDRFWLVQTHRVTDPIQTVERILGGAANFSYSVVRQKIQKREAAYLIEVAAR